MKAIFSGWKLRAVAFLGCAAGTLALAQGPRPVHLKGAINDHPVSPSSSGPTVWELRGPWSLDFRGESGRANFSAALTMEFSDIYVGSIAAASGDARRQHTHTITMNDATVMESPDDCPTGTTPIRRIPGNLRSPVWPTSRGTETRLLADQCRCRFALAVVQISSFPTLRWCLLTFQMVRLPQRLLISGYRRSTEW